MVVVMLVSVNTALKNIFLNYEFVYVIAWAQGRIITCVYRSCRNYPRRFTTRAISTASECDYLKNVGGMTVATKKLKTQMMNARFPCNSSAALVIEKSTNERKGSPNQSIH